MENSVSFGLNFDLFGVGKALGIGSGGFKASAKWKEDKMKMSDTKTGIAHAEAHCILYTVSSKEDLPSCISKDLKQRLEHGISSEPTEEQLHSFFEDFGTHAIKE